MPYEQVGKNEPVCIADEVPFEIPDSWEWVRLSSICNVLNGDRGKNYPAKSTLSSSGEFPFISAINLNGTDVTVDEKLLYLSATQYEKLNNGKLKKGDIVVCIRGSLGKHGRYQFESGAIASSLVIVRPIGLDEVFASYFMSYLDSPMFFTEIRKYDNGTAQPNLAANNFEKFFIPIPPVEEQQRILNKLSELYANLIKYDLAEKENEQLMSSFPEQLKKSILQWAVQGKLVPQDPNDEPASVLLERIRTEKEQLIKSGKIKRDKHESVIFRRDNSHYEKLDGIERCIDDEIPFEIPDSWCWVRLGTLVGIQRGASPRPKGSPEYWSKVRTQHHWIKISDITKFSINDTLLDTDEFLTDLGTTKSVFVDEDYLITAASGSLGKIAKLGISGYIYDGLMCICFKGISLEKDYIILLIQAMVEFLMSVSTGTAWKNITTDILKNLLVPLPPRSEQKKIIHEVSKISNLIGQI